LRWIFRNWGCTGLIRHRIGTGDEKRDRQLFGRTLPAGTICMKHFGKSQSTYDNKFMAVIRARLSGVAVSSAGYRVKGETPTKI
jgi:hypothetical protein